MVYREVHMIEIKEILLRLVRGESKKAISRGLGVHKQTIRRYLVLARSLGVDPQRDGQSAITDELIEGISSKDRRARREKSVSPAERLLLPLKPKIEAYLKEGLKGSKILGLLRREGISLKKSAFYRFLAKNCTSWIKKVVTVRLPETKPGEYAQADFGRLGKLWDKDAGKERLAYAFIFTLCYSRHQLVYVTFKQDISALIQGCEKAFEYFGGVPQILIVDNLKPAVIKADRYSPKINKAFLEYAQYRGFIVDPTVVDSPKGKAMVERAVPYVRDNFFAGERFIDIEDCQSRALDWCTNIAGRRIHQTIKEIPLEVFEREEKNTLKPYDGKRYDLPSWAVCKVHPDHHIHFRNALYSVPTRYIGKEVEVRGDSALVKVYYQGSLIKIHETVERGKRSTDYDDYPKELTHYTLRNPLYQIREGCKRHPLIGEYLQSLLAGPYPWHRLRSAQKLLRLSDQYGAERVARACERAQSYGVYDIKPLERMLKNNLEERGSAEPLSLSTTVRSRFERDKVSFNHYQIEVKEERR